MFSKPLLNPLLLGEDLQGFQPLGEGKKNIFYSLGCSIESDFPSFLFFFDFTNKKIHPAATIKQHIQIIGLTTNQAIHIVRNHTTKVSHRAIIPVHTHIMSARKGRTFAIVSMNLSIEAKPQYISNNPNNLIIHVIILFSS